jgi:hypothetical protein
VFWAAALAALLALGCSRRALVLAAPR